LRLRESLTQIFAEIPNETQCLAASGTARRGHVDVSLPNDVPPRSSQQRYILPSANRKVPVQSATSLTFSDCDVQPIGFPALDDSDELGKVGAGLFHVQDVGAIGQSEQVIRP
jgi:hypothetical protein